MLRRFVIKKSKKRCLGTWLGRCSIEYIECSANFDLDDAAKADLTTGPGCHTYHCRDFHSYLLYMYPILTWPLWGFYLECTRQLVRGTCPHHYQQIERALKHHVHKFRRGITEHDPTHPQGALAKLLHLGAPFGKRRPGGRVRPGRLGQGALRAPWPGRLQPNPPPGRLLAKGALVLLGGGFDQGALLKAP